MDAKVLKVGITGCGFIAGSVHVPALAKVHKCVVIGFHDTKKENAEAAKEQYLGLLQKNNSPVLIIAKEQAIVYGSVDAMAKAVDIVDIATPTRCHYEGIRAALENGKHVLCERPLARNWWESQVNKDLKEKARKVVFQLRNQAAWSSLASDEAGKLLHDQKVIGDVEFVRVLNHDSNQKHTRESPDRWDKLQNGGGALIDITPNAYTIARTWLGKSIPVSVKSERIYIQEPEWKINKVKQRIAVEDDAHFTITWKASSGKLVKSEIEASRGEKDWWPGGVVKGTKLKNNIYFEARGNKGTLDFPNVKLGLKPYVYFKATLTDGTEKEFPYPPPASGDEDDRSISEFIDCIIGDAKPRNDYNYAEEMLAAMGAAYLSEKKERAEVTIDDFKKHCESIAAGKTDPEEQVIAVIADITSTIK